MPDGDSTIYQHTHCILAIRADVHTWAQTQQHCKTIRIAKQLFLMHHQLYSLRYIFPMDFCKGPRMSRRTFVRW